MKIRSYKLLFRVMSFLSDKTNGFPLFVKYKLLLGTLIIGLSASGCTTHRKKQVTCYEPVPEKIEKTANDSINSTADSVAENQDTIIESFSANDTLRTIPAPPEIITCYDIAEATEMYYGLSDTPPTYKGGTLDEFLKDVKESIQYPEEAHGVQGRVVVSFVIDREGNMTKVTLLKRVYPLLDEEAKRVVLSLSGGWTAGSHNGSLVNTIITIPVTFKIEAK